MKIIKSDKFKLELQNIMSFIAQNSLKYSLSFYSEIIIQINKLDFMPYKFRKSIYFDNENIRDLIFKGYVIPYEINETKQEIIILDILKYRKI